MQQHFSWALGLMFGAVLCGGGLWVEAGDLEISPLASRTGAQQLKLIRTENDDRFFDLKARQFFDGRLPSTGDRTASMGGIIHWRVKRKAVDPDGITHIFHSQQFIPPEGWGKFPDGIPEEGFPIVGGELAFYSDIDGTILGVNGAQYPDVKDLITPTIHSAEAAVASAISAARAAGRNVVPLGELDTLTVEELEDGASLRLHPQKSSASVFGFVWRLSLPMSNGEYHIFRMDASNSEILSVWDGIWRSSSDNCSPETSVELSASWNPLNPEIDGWRLKATRRTSDPHQWDAARNKTSWTPRIWVFEGNFGDGTPSCGDTNYKLMERVPEHPSTDGPDYDGEDPDADGYKTARAAGDAQAWSYEAFKTLFDYAGFAGFNGNMSSTAKIVVMAIKNVGFAGWYSPDLDDDDGGPAGAVVFGPGWADAYPDHPEVEQELSLVAAQDIVAHEWGHSALYYGPEWRDGSIPEVASLQEGWADVLGMGVEWMTQSRASDLGSPEFGRADWMGGEDTRRVFRRADSTNPVGPPFFMPTYWDDGIVHFSDFNFLSFHRDDEAFRPSEAIPLDSHWVGHKASVVFYLMAEGTENPGYNDCDGGPCIQDKHVLVSLAYEGLAKMLLWKTTSADGWEDLADNLTFVSIGASTKAASPGFVISTALPWNDYCLQASSRFSLLKAGYQAFGNIGYPPVTPICSHVWD